MRRTLLAASLLALAFALGCSADSSKSPQPAYTLVLLKTGPKSGQLSKAESQEAFAGHFANMSRLADERKLVLAGPFLKEKHDAALRGLFVIKSGVRAEAAEWAGSDPTTRLGVFVQELHDFDTDAPLPAMLERELEREARTAAEGKPTNPGDGARNYALLNCDDYTVAQRELAPLLGSGGVFLLARVDGTKALAVLDAQDAADARQKFAAVLARVGKHELDDWFATDQLARMTEK